MHTYALGRVSNNFYMVHIIQFSTIVPNELTNTIFVREYKLIANGLKISKILQILSVKIYTIH